MRIIDYINQGGSIMYILLGLNILGFAIMLSKFVLLLKEQKQTDEQSNLLSKTIKEKAGGTDSMGLIEMSKQELTLFISRLEKGLNTVKIIAAISPLIGLLGTVIGVLVAFKVMSETGLNNPASFAQGISMALITTVGGMIVAIPHYIGHSYLLGMLDGIESKLESKILSQVL